MVRIKSEKNLYSSSSRKTTVGSLNIQFLSYLGVLLFVFWMFLSIVLKFNGKTLQCVLTWWYLVSFSLVFVSFDVKSIDIDNWVHRLFSDPVLISSHQIAPIKLDNKRIISIHRCFQSDSSIMFGDTILQLETINYQKKQKFIRKTTQ